MDVQRVIVDYVNDVRIDKLCYIVGLLQLIVYQVCRKTWELVAGMYSLKAFGVDSSLNENLINGLIRNLLN